MKRIAHRRRRIAVPAAAATFGLVLGACSSSSGPPGQQGAGMANLQLASALVPYDSCDTALQSIRTEAGKRVTAYGLTGTEYAMTDRAAVATNGAAPPTTPVAPSAKSAEAPSSGGADQAADQGASAAHSETNVVEKGVDEPDQVKTDGRRLFVVNGSTLYAYTLDGGTPYTAGTLSLSGAGNHEILLSGDRLLVLTKAAGPVRANRSAVAEDDVMSGGGATVGTDIAEVDVSNPAAPRITSQITVDGSVLDARMVGGTARVVLSSGPAPLDFVQPRSASRTATQRALKTNQRVVAESSLDDWLPSYSVSGSSERRPLVDCARLSHPKQFGGLGMVTVMTVELGQGINPRNTVAIQADADHVYASTDRLYVSTNRVPDANEPATTTATAGTATAGTAATSGAGASVTRPGIDCDPACPPPSTATVPDAPRTAPVPPSPPEYRTSIHAFDISGSGPATYRGSGEVRGHLLNDFSMSADDGNLRVATTDGAPWGGTRAGSESFVTVMTERDGGLAQIGQVGGMGRGEQIRAVRFIGKTGYVVTFRQTDPLYTVDLSDPRNPKVAGELQLLGYSAYLHPVGGGRLLGIGQDATDRGRTLGTQVALFDVSNPAAPRLVQKTTVPGGHSEAEQDYHAFLWWDPTHLAVIPVQSYDQVVPAPPVCPTAGPCTNSGVAAPRTGFVGAIGFTVDEGGITELGRIQNPATGGGCGPTQECEPSPCPPGATCVNSADAGAVGPTTTRSAEEQKICEATGQCATTTTTAPPAPAVVPTPPSTLCDPACPPPSTTSTTSPSTTSPSTSSSSSSTTSSTSSTLPDPSTSSTTASTEPPSTTPTTGRPGGPGPVPPVTAGQGSPISRTVVIGDKVLTISPTGILVSSLDRLGPVGWLPFS